jgi:hypothetical protein
MLPGATPQPYGIDPIFLDVERGVILDEQVGNLPIGDHDANVSEPFGNLRFRHLASEGKDHDQGTDAGAKFPLVALRQPRQVSLAGAGRVPLFLAEQDIVRADDDILDNDFAVPLELGIWWQQHWIDRHILAAANVEAIQFAALDARNGTVPFRFGGVIGWRRDGSVGSERGLALLAFEAVDLVP